MTDTFILAFSLSHLCCLNILMLSNLQKYEKDLKDSGELQTHTFDQYCTVFLPKFLTNNTFQWRLTKTLFCLFVVFYQTIKVEFWLWNKCFFFRCVMSIFPSIENLLITSTEVIIGFCRHSSETRRFFSVRNVTKKKSKKRKSFV